MLFPGLIDCYTHLDMTSDGAPGESLISLGADAAQYRVVANGRRSLEAGVTALKDNGEPADIVLDAARRVRNSGRGTWPRRLISGPPLTVPRGH